MNYEGLIRENQALREQVGELQQKAEQNEIMKKQLHQLVEDEEGKEGAGQKEEGWKNEQLVQMIQEMKTQMQAKDREILKQKMQLTIFHMKPAEHDSKSNLEQIQQLHASLDQVSQEKLKLEYEVSNLKVVNQSQAAQLEKLRKDNAELAGKVKTQLAELKQKHKDLAKLQSQCQELSKGKRDLELQLKITKSRNDTLVEDMNKNLSEQE